MHPSPDGSHNSDLSDDNDYSDVDTELDIGSPNRGSESPTLHGSDHGSISGGCASDCGLTGDNRRHARAQHNALERRRRDNIKDMYSSLRDELPNFSQERASRAQILSHTVDQMTALNQDVKTLEAEVAEQESIQQNLLRELAELEKEVGDLQSKEQTTAPAIGAGKMEH